MNVQTLPRTARRWPVAILAAVLSAGLTAAVFVFAVGTGSEQSAPSIAGKPVRRGGARRLRAATRSTPSCR